MATQTKKSFPKGLSTYILAKGILEKGTTTIEISGQILTSQQVIVCIEPNLSEAC